MMIHLPVVIIRTNWRFLTEKLLQYLGKTMIIEQREAVQRLQQMKQKRNESIATHTINWMTHMHDIPRKYVLKT